MAQRIGIVGGGQLGRMLAMAAKQLGFDVLVLDPTPNSPAGQVAQQLVGSFTDAQAIEQLAKQVDVLTFEIESANADALHSVIQTGLPVHPSPKTLSIIKDKLKQKEFLRQAGIPVADFMPIESANDIVTASRQFGYPLVLKARFDAYDGRGNARIESANDINQGLEKLAGRKLYVERFVPFIKELAVVAARSVSGEIVTYQTVETIHKNHICHTVIAPAPVDAAVRSKAENLAMQVLNALSGVGVFGIEMFLLEDDTLLINEIAPRVHNSGHFTIEGSHTSQFEQHIRAVSGMPLGSATMKVPCAVMVNILGDRQGLAVPRGIDSATALGNVGIHIYGKHETKPERKMGHLTATGDNLDEVLERAMKARSLISI